VGRQTLTFDPEDAEAVEGAAVSYAKLGQYAKADEKLERLLALRPSDVEAVRLLVSALPSPTRSERRPSVGRIPEFQRYHRLFEVLRRPSASP